MEKYEPYPSLALALLAGLLVGLEREQSKPSPETGRGFPGGIRAYPLLALTGAVAVLLSPSLGAWPLVAAMLGFSALLVVSYLRDVEAGHVGFTSEASALLTVLLGAFAASKAVLELPHRIFVVASLAVITTVILAQKEPLRAFSARVSKDDIFATLKFLIVAVVVVPLLPNEPLGPYGALNPFRIGLMVMLIAGLSFVGYVAMRLVGPGRGMLLTGAVGGLVSSTAVTMAAAGRAKANPELGPIAALAVVIASTLMFARVLVTVFIVERSLFLGVLLPVGAMGAVALAVTLAQFLRDRRYVSTANEVKMSNPFELGASIKFGAFFVAILLVSRWASETFGASGTYLTGLLAGLTDVDAITLSMASLVHNQQVAPEVAARTIAVAVASNTAVKGGLAVIFGGGAFGRRVAVALAVVLVVGLAIVALA